MADIKIVIFDLDGTLIDAYQAISESFNHVMRQMGLAEVAHEQIKRSVGWGEHELLAPYVPEGRMEEARALYRAHHVEALTDKVRLLPGAFTLLEGLKMKGFRLAVASNRPTETALLLLDQLNIKKFFDYIVCGDKLRRFKPDPGILFDVLRQFSFKAKEAVYVGDMALDAETGRRADVRTVIVTTGSSSKDEIETEDPYRIIERIGQVKEILEEV